MKRKIEILLAVVLLLKLTSCSNNDVKTEGVLFPQISLDNIESKKTDLSDIFENYRIVSLETTDESLIGGRSVKIIKRNDYYFIKSINDIVVFDLDGKFIRKLSHAGYGPGEYDQLNDFDVVSKYDEIWVSASKGIYRYGINDLEYKDMIPLPFAATQFKYLDDDNIIIRTTEDEIFKICSVKGEIIKSFFPHDNANSSYNPVGFITIGDNIVIHIESSNNVVCYNLSTNEFGLQNVIKHNPNLESIDINREYFEKYGYLDQTDKVSESYIGISSFRCIKDMVLMIIRYPGNNWGLNLTKGNISKGYMYAPQNSCTLINNIAESANMKFYNTLLCGESDDSFIFKYDIENDADSNPYLLDVKYINL